MSDHLSDRELLEFISGMSRELIAMARERGMVSLLPGLRSADAASRNLLEKIKHD